MSRWPVLVLRRQRDVLVLALAVAFGLLLVPRPSEAELFEGSVSATNTWRFSDFDCGCAPCIDPCLYTDRYRVDFVAVFVFDPPIGPAIDAPLGIAVLGEVPLETVHAAPDTGYSEVVDSSVSETPAVGHVYVLKTRGGGHALIKLTFVGFGSIAFDYKYQNDGTGAFEPVAIESATWTRIKALSADH